MLARPVDDDFDWRFPVIPSVRYHCSKRPRPDRRHQMSGTSTCYLLQGSGKREGILLVSVLERIPVKLNQSYTCINKHIIIVVGLTGVLLAVPS